MEWSKKVFLALLEKDPNFNTKIELYGFQDYSVLQNPTATTTNAKANTTYNYESTPKHLHQHNG